MDLLWLHLKVFVLHGISKYLHLRLFHEETFLGPLAIDEPEMIWMFWTFFNNPKPLAFKLPPLTQLTEILFKSVRRIMDV